MQQPDPGPEDTIPPAEAQAVENRIQFVLSPRHLRLLDDLCYHTRRATGYKLNRSEIVRVLIELLGDRDMDYRRIRSEGCSPANTLRKEKPVLRLGFQQPELIGGLAYEATQSLGATVSPCEVPALQADG